MESTERSNDKSQTNATILPSWGAKQSHIFRWELLGIVVCILAYSSLVNIGPVRHVGLIPQFFPIILLLACLYLLACAFFGQKTINRFCYLSHFIEMHSGSLILWLILSFLLIGSQLMFNWSGEVLSYFFIGGLLPNSDAGNYYEGARNLLIEGDLSIWSSRRPMMTTYLASILAISNFSLIDTVSIISGLAAFSIALVAASIRRTEPAAVALWAFVLMFFFYNGYVGTTLSENLGLTVGGLAFVSLWAAADKRKIHLFLLGVFFMTLAQITRSGAVLVLPLLIMWGVFWLASNWRERLVFLLGGITAIIAGFLINRLLLLAGGGDPALAFSNFSDTLYGLSVASQLSIGAWKQIVIDYPDVASLTEPARSQSIYRLAFDNIISQPGTLATALLRNLQTYTISNGGLNMVAGTKAWVLVQIPSLLGVFWCIRDYKNPRYALLLLVLGGILLSATIVTEDGGLRVFAATVPFSAVIAALGLRWFYRSSIHKYKESNNYIPDKSGGNYEKFAAYSGVLLVISLLLTISLAPLNIAPRPVEEISCRAGHKSAVIYFPASAAVYLKQEVNDVSAGFPSVMLTNIPSAIETNNRKWPINKELKQVPLSLVLSDKFYLLPTEAFADDPQQVTACVEKNSWLYVSQDLNQ